jgi:LysR family hydrogen peroxide-inducible transcriptional activator
MPINHGGPTIAQIRAFLAVAEFLHFRQAAATLGVSQPTLSATVASCEEALDTKLVERTTRRVMLTSAGERLLPRARQVLDAVDSLVTEADQARRPFSGTLRLGLIPTVAPYLLPAALRGLRQDFPELELEVHEERTSQLFDGLTTWRLGAAVLALPAGQAGLTEHALYDEDFVLVVPHGHPMAKYPTVSPSALRDLNVLLLEEGHCLHDQARDVCREAGGGARATTSAASLATLVQLVAADLGVTLLPETAVPVETRRGRLEVVRFATPAPSRRIGLLHRESSGQADEYATIAAKLRQAIRTRKLPVRLTA